MVKCKSLVKMRGVDLLVVHCFMRVGDLFLSSFKNNDEYLVMTCSLFVSVGHGFTVTVITGAVGNEIYCICIE